mgnify:FL=1|tara:strand:- start:20 stop:889 length:870 start_codon:yes stop_codon:yes gene_type:complete
MKDSEIPPSHQYADSDEASHIYLLPNSLTAGNLFFGFLAIMRCIEANYATDPAIINGHFVQAVWFIFFGVVCDAFDGRVARMGGRESLFGIEFDSIADVISFGVAPAMMMIFLILKPTEQYDGVLPVSQLIGFIYLLCAAVRLARFNVLTHPMLTQSERLKGTKDFIGLPVPAAAAMVASLVLVYISFEKYGYEMHGFELLMPPLMLAVAFLMISNIPYPSFKEIDWQTSTRLQTFILFIFSLGIAFVFKELFFAIFFFSYIMFGPIRYFFRIYRAKKRLKEVNISSGE